MILHYFLKKGKGLKNRGLKKVKNTCVLFLHFFDPHNLAKTWVWQKSVMTRRWGLKNYVEIRIRIVKSPSDQPKTAIFNLFLDFWAGPTQKFAVFF